MSEYTTCKDCVDLLMDFLEGNLETKIEKQLEEHLSYCPPCKNFLESYRTCSELTGKFRDQPVEIPSELENRLKDFLQQQIKAS